MNQPNGNFSAIPVIIEGKTKTRSIVATIVVIVCALAICAFFLLKWNKTPVNYSEVQKTYLGPPGYSKISTNINGTVDYTYENSIMGIKIVYDRQKNAGVSLNQSVGHRYKASQNFNMHPGIYAGVIYKTTTNVPLPDAIDSIIINYDTFRLFGNERRGRRVIDLYGGLNGPFHISDSVYNQAKKLVEYLYLQDTHLITTNVMSFENIGSISRLSVITSKRPDLRFWRKNQTSFIDIKDGGMFLVSGQFIKDTMGYYISKDTIRPITQDVAHVGALDYYSTDSIYGSLFQQLFLEKNQKYDTSFLLQYDLFYSEKQYYRFGRRERRRPLSEIWSYTFTPVKNTHRSKQHLQSSIHKKPHSIFTLEDVSQSVEILKITSKNKSHLQRLEYEFKTPIEIRGIYPKPDIVYTSGFVYNDPQSLAYILQNGLTASLHYPEWDSTQTKRFYAITLFITILVTYLLKLLWNMVIDKYASKKVFLWCVIGIVSLTTIFLAIYSGVNSGKVDYGQEMTQTFDGLWHPKQQCPKCDGNGEINGRVCDYCRGEKFTHIKYW